MVRPGELTKLATFKRIHTSASDWEETPEVWETVCEAYVCLEPASGNEPLDSQQQRGLTTYKATWRYSINGATVNQSCRMHIGERTFAIHSVVNVGTRNHWLEAMVTEAA